MRVEPSSSSSQVFANTPVDEECYIAAISQDDMDDVNRSSEERQQAAITTTAAAIAFPSPPQPDNILMGR